jgi:YidC/Oxa1 family membrane protein insertase
MSQIFNQFLVIPLYNVLVLILDYVPLADLGFSVILLTIIVRLILFPLSKSAIKTQLKMKDIQKPLEEIKIKYKGDQQKMAIETMKFYKDNDIKPFSGILLLFIQLPIIFALYFVFLKEGLPQIDLTLLYSFVSAPEFVNPKFLGIFDLASKSITLALLAGLTQFIQARLMFKKANQTPSVSKENSFQNDLMKSMQIQMQYVLPGLMIAFSYSLGAVVALYFTTSNIFSILQELYLKKKLEKEISLKNVQAPQN